MAHEPELRNELVPRNRPSRREHAARRPRGRRGQPEPRGRRSGEERTGRTAGELAWRKITRHPGGRREHRRGRSDPSRDLSDLPPRLAFVERSMATYSDPRDYRRTARLYEPVRGRYVALGDSYSAGTGTSDYSFYERCQRGPLAYSSLIRARRRTIVTCGGATTEDVLEEQVGRLTPRARLVTISIGGNDTGFGDVVKKCASPWEFESECLDEVEDAQAFIRTELPERLDEVYREIADRSPRARVVVVGYPRLYSRDLERDGENCNLATRVSAEEVRRLNDTGDLLARVTRRRAQAHGFRFADPRAAFEGHGICSDEEWINGVSSPLADSYHPNAAGHQAYARVVSAKVGRLPRSPDAREGPLTLEEIAARRGYRTARLDGIAAEIADLDRELADLHEEDVATARQIYAGEPVDPGTYPMMAGVSYAISLLDERHGLELERRYLKDRANR